MYIKNMKNKIIKIIFIAVSFFISVGNSKAGMIIGHEEAGDFENIPASYINQAKTNFKIAYGHTSHGSQVVTGMDMVNATFGSPYDYSIVTSACNSTAFLCDRFPPLDLGSSSWDDYTRNLLTNNASYGRNVVMWSWCGQISSTYTTAELLQSHYLDPMASLENDYPNVTFIYMTQHLDTTGSMGTLHQRNEQIRQWVSQSPRRVLYDFADIERYDPAGVDYLDLRAGAVEGDGCRYYEGSTLKNWCTTWCASHPNDCPTCSSCAHSYCLNCFLKGKAFWYMMARLAGWDGGIGEDMTVPASPSGLAVN